MPEPDCFLRYRISHATRNFTSGKSDVYALVAAARHGFEMVYGLPLQRRVITVRCICISAVYAVSVRPSVGLSVRHVPELRQNE